MTMPAALTKLMAILWTQSLQKELEKDPSSPITVLAVHPGLVNTSWTPVLFWPIRWLVSFFLMDPSQGSYNSVFAAASKAVAANKEKYKGVYTFKRIQLARSRNWEKL